MLLPRTFIVGRVFNARNGQFRVESVGSEMLPFPGGQGIFQVGVSTLGIGKPMTNLQLANLRLKLLTITC